MLRFIDLFAGIGGIRLAFEQVGGRCVFSSEIDPHARETYHANFKDTPAGDIREIKASDIPPFDILCAGFPCQAFSIIGTQGGLNDPRGALFFEIVRILAHHKPKAFLLENVKQLATHKQGETLQVLLKHLENLGYSMRYRVLNALDFGLPQKRERLIFVGFLDAHLAKTFSFDFAKIPYDLAQVLEPNPPQSSLASVYIRKKRLQSVQNKRLFSPSIWHENKSGNVSILNHACALRANASHNYQLVDGVRHFTPRELLNLMGFPKGFKIVVSPRHLRTQCGNSVCVPVIAAVARHLVELLKNAQCA
ncbi:DNA-cytosine methyltransferase [Helicobacter heilmannii]|uniref:DNA cytosine methyltransferase n=1 Tax=Helicobacter heilmannii TaxID=35817 RepID=UPI00028B9953|nr:DNA (cytosine-5-)-methyltransferase [Helicobacter heilmannii]BDQ27918.1 cytosine-specific methyltransferase [Helicobacter heilmannii]CCM73662.1 DNA-cytosine methyltransferase [Helicobacter heilmannii ASB1.4]CRF49229.1 DNA-cytosine methyltransferase [Helicobacter heilmannii]